MNFWVEGAFLLDEEDRILYTVGNSLFWLRKRPADFLWKEETGLKNGRKIGQCARILALKETGWWVYY